MKDRGAISAFACILIAGLLLAPIAAAQGTQKPPLPPGYQPPDKTEWIDAGLDPDEYDTAVRYQVSLEDWKNMHQSRHTHTIAGWSCIAVGLLAFPIQATVHWGGGVDWNQHPEQEVYIMVSVAAGAAILM